MSIIPVIVSGGAGSRLWPLSREAHPKPFIVLPDGDTLIGKTYARARALAGVENIITVTNRELLFLTADAYAATGAMPVSNTFLLESVGRDTAAAVALAVVHAVESGNADAVLLAMPADHLVLDEEAFGRAVQRAASLAATGRIVTFGIVPERAETGFGYIEVDGESVRRFVEKPDAETAASYVESGRFLWNSGMFCFAAHTMLEAMEAHCPDILASAREGYRRGRRNDSHDRITVEVDPATFGTAPAISIDYAVMEKLEDAACVPTACGWSDVGSWAAIAELVEPDAEGNRVIGETLLEATSDSFVYSEDRLVGLVGVSDLLIIDTPDALLVAHKQNAQKVKAVFNRLRDQNHEAAKLHRTAHRPWGTYTVLEEGPRFKIKRIEVKPGARLSLQAHHHRSEHWVVVSGTAKVVNGDKEIMLTTNQSTYIPCGHKHRLENPGVMKLVMIEVQSGDYLGEDDIIRFDDVYGRS
ncbi:mannose-1-phosphate guanylyltransferase/mannose-6-phosphate isomerase [Devosia nitrariae]|uniref:mannose-1-phosphate guanylyltransferase n=1 Tax=Devosia nitrariae TaxID=2071872 RepID=A0ABQ5W4S1_9HYPH|nr:mannose-1-phosphate guanylyltransferase/mannose-6-phosphate isomerase [Devosia nitrariae]GLQ54972.1 phosphomannose isomerase/mannose-1-phosphate guanylyl transferase [Devosia nitrariae]